MLAVARQQLVFEQAENGRLAGIDVDIATYALHWMIHETFNQELVQHTRFDPDQVIDTVTQLLLRAIGPPAA
jgi:Tfp pilus assembly pilus retraction ATPase PilT